LTVDPVAMDSVKSVDVWFGALLATLGGVAPIGIVALVGKVALGFHFLRRPPHALHRGYPAICR
jgi:hypothetical protein